MSDYRTTTKQLLRDYQMTFSLRCGNFILAPTVYINIQFLLVTPDSVLLALLARQIHMTFFAQLVQWKKIRFAKTNASEVHSTKYSAKSCERTWYHDSQLIRKSVLFVGTHHHLMYLQHTHIKTAIHEHSHWESGKSLLPSILISQVTKSQHGAQLLSHKQRPCLLFYVLCLC